MTARIGQGPSTSELNREEILGLWDEGWPVIRISSFYSEKLGRTVTSDQIRARLRNLGVTFDFSRRYTNKFSSGQMPKPLLSESQIAEIYDGRLYGKPKAAEGAA